MPSHLRPLARLLPTCAILLLVFAAAAGMRTPPAPASAESFACDSTIGVEVTNDAYPLAQGWGVTQPFDPTANVEACSLRVFSYYNYNDLRIVAWDAVALTPDASTVPLRYFSYDPSAMERNHLMLDLGSRPVVTKRLGQVADPPRTRLALDFTSVYYSNGETMYYDHAGPDSAPIGYQYLMLNNARLPLQGAHPVLSFGLCPGDATTQSLLLAQSVMTANSVLDTTWYDVVQRFRVPATVTLHWVELAQMPEPGNVYNFPASVLQVADAPTSTPPTSFPILLAQGVFGATYLLPQWTSHADFDAPPTLIPGHDYWLLVRMQHTYEFGARVLTGTESGDFQDEIGPLYGRTSASGPWTPIPGRALSMRLIGSPTGLIDVPSPPLVPGAVLHLALAPNPAHGAVFATWSGGHGAAHLDVLDARGRRIARGAEVDAARGRWLWTGRTDDGRLAPAGLYFVRIHDDAGHGAVERVVIVR